MDRYYFNNDKRPAPYQRVSHQENLYHPTPQIRVPQVVDDAHYYQDVNMATVPGRLYDYMPQNMNAPSQIREFINPGSSYAPAFSRNYTNTAIDYQESSFNAWNERHLINIDNEDHYQVPKVQTFDNQHSKSGPSANSVISDGDKQQGAFHTVNVYTQSDVVGHTSGYNGSTPEAVQTSSGSRNLNSKTTATQVRNQKKYEASNKDGSATKEINQKPKDVDASGMRMFTGSVEKVMKWYKSLLNVKVNIMFEVIARCVTSRPGKGCAKQLLLRDASGPVLQAIYYEIDFLLPEIKPGSTLRLVGKMVGSNKMVAFKVRETAPGEASSLPRLCAISQHMVTKLINAK